MNKTRDKTLSEEFDSAEEAMQQLLNGEGLFASKDGKKDGVLSLQANLEDLTRSVSSVEMFSKNELYEEMDPKSLKFLLLPYFLGAVWQQKSGLERKDICDVAEVYFVDFLERLIDCGILQTPPRILSLKRERDSSGGGGDDGTTGTPSAPSSKPQLPSGNLNRQLKIERFKKGKELEDKIKLLKETEEIVGSDDPITTQELYVSLLQKYALDAEAELESIYAEKELLASHAEQEKQETASVPSQPRKSQLPFETFIITKSDVEKKVFGKGYPSLPVMTVEELYRDRVAKGIWAKPTTVADTNQPTADTESDQVREEALEEADDETRRAQQQAMDEYKDMHRRGWGNRLNRS